MFLFSKRPDRLWAKPNAGSFNREKRPGREFHHSPTPSAEIKNEWSYTSTLPICLHWVYRDIFTFTADNFTDYIIVSWIHTKSAFIDSFNDPVSFSDSISHSTSESDHSRCSAVSSTSAGTSQRTLLKVFM